RLLNPRNTSNSPNPPLSFALNASARVPAMSWLRAVSFLAVGAAAFAAAPALVSRLQPPLTIDFSTDPPARLAAGFYPAEHTEDGMWFAWTQGAFGLALPTLDRSTPWIITIRLSGSR